MKNYRFYSSDFPIQILLEMMNMLGCFGGGYFEGAKDFCNRRKDIEGREMYVALLEIFEAVDGSGELAKAALLPKEIQYLDPKAVARYLLIFANWLKPSVLGTRIGLGRFYDVEELIEYYYAIYGWFMEVLISGWSVEKIFEDYIGVYYEVCGIRGMPFRILREDEDAFEFKTRAVDSVIFTFKTPDQLQEYLMKLFRFTREYRPRDVLLFIHRTLREMVRQHRANDELRDDFVEKLVENFRIIAPN